MRLREAGGVSGYHFLFGLGPEGAAVGFDLAVMVLVFSCSNMARPVRSVSDAILVVSIMFCHFICHPRGELKKRNFMHAKSKSSSETTHVIQATIGHLPVKVFFLLSRGRSGI